MSSCKLNKSREWYFKIFSWGNIQV